MQGAKHPVKKEIVDRYAPYPFPLRESGKVGKWEVGSGGVIIEPLAILLREGGFFTLFFS